jgi:hypothetical protein
MKIKKIISYLSLFTIHYSLFTILISCDKIKPPYTEKGSNIITDTTKYVKHVLLEEFTGFKCGNCPAAHKKLEELELIYGVKLISYALHTGYFALPDGSGNYTTDFRCQTGNDIDNKFKISQLSLPQGMINRITIDNNKAIDMNTWEENINNILQTAPKADLKIFNYFETSSLRLSSSIFITILDTINHPVVLSAYVVEDSISDWQYDFNPSPHDIQNYIHRNVLRGSLNGSWGDTLKNMSFQKGQLFNKNYQYTLKSNWNYNQVYIVAFLYNENTYEILQSEKAKILN